jgi:hypothetical protein
VRAVERARTIVEAYDAELRVELPENVHLFDAHTHLGHDIDGMSGGYEELTAMLDRHGFAGAFVFCMDEHDRVPAFCVPNDRTLAHAERSGGRLVPFVRLDLTERPLEEAKRALDRARRRSRSTTSGWGRSSPSPSSARYPSSSTEVAGCRRSPSTWRRSSAGTRASS